MSEGEKRYREVFSLIDENNITTGLLSELTGIPRNRIKSLRSNPRKFMSEEKYKVLKDAINVILNEKVDLYDLKYRVAPKFSPKKLTNRMAIKEFLKKNNLQNSAAARLLNKTPHSFNSLISLGTRSDISTEYKDEIISRLTEALAERARKNKQ